MIEAATATDLTRIATSERDVRGAFMPGFVPEDASVARTRASAPSDDPLSVAAPEGTYFVTTDRSGKVVLSRDGGFAFSDGELKAGDGRPALGFAVGEGRTLGMLHVDCYDAALGRISNARIEADGTFSYARSSIDPRSGERRSERVTIGRLALARLPAGTQPERIDAVHVRSPAGVAVQVGVPGDGKFAALATYARDVGRVDIVAGLERMKEAYVAYEALRAAHHARSGVDKTAMDLVK